MVMLSLKAFVYLHGHATWVHALLRRANEPQVTLYCRWTQHSNASCHAEPLFFISCDVLLVVSSLFAS